MGIAAYVLRALQLKLHALLHAPDEIALLGWVGGRCSMPNDWRVWMPGGTFFFTVNLLRRCGNDVIAAQCPSVIVPYVVCAYARSELFR